MEIDLQSNLDDVTPSDLPNDRQNDLQNDLQIAQLELNLAITLDSSI